MNTWVISPNWLAWGLLAITATSLLIIALCLTLLTVQARKARSNISDTHTHNLRDAGEDSIWYKVLVVVNVVLILFFAGVVCLSHCKEIELKDASALISAFGVLVTFLVGWQIATSLISREEVRKIERVSSKLNTLEAQLSILRNTPDAHLFYVLGINKYEQRDYFYAFDYFATAVNLFIENKVPYEKFSTVALSYMDSCLAMASQDDSVLDSFKDQSQRVSRQLGNILSQVDNIERFAEEARKKTEAMQTKARELGVI